MNRAEVYALIDGERDRQAAKWGGPHDWGRGDCSSAGVAPIVKVAVLAEECGEVARAVLNGEDIDLRTELVQVAAVAVAWLETFEHEVEAEALFAVGDVRAGQHNHRLTDPDWVPTPQACPACAVIERASISRSKEGTR